MFPKFFAVLALLKCVESQFLENFTTFHGIKDGSKCSDQYDILDFNTKLKMFDASTKIPSGLMDGNFFDLGNFDECYKIETETTIGTVFGKFCLGTIAVDRDRSSRSRVNKMDGYPPQLRMTVDPSTSGYHFSICVPSGCRADEIQGISNYSENFCYSKNALPELDANAIASIVTISIFLEIVAISSIYDIFLYYSGKKPRHELLIAFSALTNGRKLFTSTTNPDQLLCLHGIKVISTMWIIIGHNYATALTSPLLNIPEFVDFQHTFEDQFFMNATIAVDTFFVLGGLVSAYTFIKGADRGAKFNVPLSYVHRFLRLTPAFGVMVLIHAHLLKYMGNGPVWGQVDEIFGRPCRDHWWSSLFYFTNYMSNGQLASCVPQTWYLSVDMQLFLLSPLILIPLKKFPEHTVKAMVALSVVGIIVPFALAYHYELDAFYEGDSEKFNRLYYVQTHTRFAPYVIGMILGYYLYQLKKSGKKLHMHPIIALGLWLVGITGLLACVLASFDTATSGYDRWGHSLYIAFNRPAWAVAVCIVVFLCVADYGGPIDVFLSLPVFQILGKLSYSMYLMHYAIIAVRYGSMKSQIRYSNVQMMTTFWGDFMFTIVLSTVLCLTFEMPIPILEKYLFGRGKAPPKNDVNRKTEP